MKTSEKHINVECGGFHYKIFFEFHTYKDLSHEEYIDLQVKFEGMIQDVLDKKPDEHE